MAIFAISYCVSTLYGMGKHAILATQPRSLIVTFTLASCAYMISILCVKLSLLALYRRIFPTRWVQITCLAVGSVVVAYTIAQGLSTIFQCIPFDSLWDQSISARCINLNLQPLIMGIINVVTDVVIYAIPMGPIWKLNLPTARKWQLSGLFLVGGLYVTLVVYCQCRRATARRPQLTRLAESGSSPYFASSTSIDSPPMTPHVCPSPRLSQVLN